MLSDEDKKWLVQQFEHLAEKFQTHQSRVERNKEHWNNLASGNIPQALRELGFTIGELIERVEKLENKQ
jgi:C1A family cysteine protease